MTETNETPEQAPVSDSPAKAGTGLAATAIGLSVLALALGIGALVAPFVPALQRLLPVQQPISAPDYGQTIAALQQQVQALSQQPVPAIDVAPLQERLEKIEQQTTATAATLDEQLAKKQVGSVRPAALAFVRVENRLLRGEPFTSELALLRETATLTPEQDRDLTAAASGVAPTAELVAALRDQERAARRAERMATVDGPLNRIWAELQSLVLIKDSSVPPASDDRFDALVMAVRQGGKGTTEAAWATLSAPAQKLLYANYGEVERRQRAEAALQQLATVVLAGGE